MRLEDHDNHVDTEDEADRSAEHSHVEHINKHISEMNYCFESLCRVSNCQAQGQGQVLRLDKGHGRVR